MKKYLLLFFILPITQIVIAQRIIKGFVKNQKNNKAISGVNITLMNTYDGTTTDSLGKFEFTTTEIGNQTLDISKINFTGTTLAINLDTTVAFLIIPLKEKINELEAVVISAGSFEASDKKKGTVLDPIDIVTTASANGDITGALKTLPGTQQVGESEGLFVRGGSGNETKIFIDGGLVNNFFYSSSPGIAARGRFNPFLFKGTFFSAGGYSALYGQALSSALLLESKDLNDQTEADFGVSVVGAGGGFQRLTKNKKASFGFSFNHTNLALAFAVIKQKQDYKTTPIFNDMDANFRVKTKGNGIIKFYSYLSSGKVGFTTKSIDTLGYFDGFQFNNLNTLNTLSLKQPLGNRWILNTIISYGTNSNKINNSLEDNNKNKVYLLVPDLLQKNFNFENKQKFAQARVVLEKKFNGLNAIRFGSETFYSNENFTIIPNRAPSFITKQKEQLTAAFIETDFYVNNDLAIKVGTRTEHSSLINKINIGPRLSVALKLKDKAQLSFATGIFYQSPETKYLTTSIPNLKFSNAVHYILQYQKLGKGTTFRMEAFHKQYNNLYKLNGNGGIANSNGIGYASGFEFFWRDKKNIKNLDYWISYSYLNTKREFLNFPNKIQPNFAAPHNFSLVAKKFSLPWKTGFNASYTYSVGRPYYDIIFNNSASKFEMRNQGFAKDFHNLSFSLNYLPSLGKKTKNFTVWVLGINNVPGFNQEFSKKYSYNGFRNESITPPSKRFVFIGCFMSFGIDKSEDIINNSL